VDAERNVASAISPKTFEFFIKACSSYLKNPLITYFFPTTICPWSIQKIKTVLLDQPYQYIGIVFSKPKILSENLYPQLRKALRSITAACENHDFLVYDTQFHIDTLTNQVYLLIKTSSDPLPPTYTHMGPPINLKENTKHFLSKWSKHKDLVGPPFEKNGRTYVNIKRPYRHITHFLEEYLHQLNMGKHIDKKIQNEFNILETKELIQPPLASFWTRYLDNKKPWER
jgi:tRNA nucleotidyltransferase (CCA-adding enzyme)